MDPFLDLIRLLRPQATLWARIDGTGRWGVSFRRRNDLLFCRVEQGECLLTRPGLPTLSLQPDDFVLIRTSTAFNLTSDPSVEPVDSETLVALTGSVGLKLGDGTVAPVALRGGRFVFDTANEQLLIGLLPQVVHVTARDSSSPQLRNLLKMNEAESLRPGPASEFVIVRLMELILVEILRSQRQPPQASHGLLAGLADPVTARALSAMHHNVAHNWTVASLARLSGVSRSTFAARFRAVVGVGPIDYLLQWRMALAKDDLRRGTRTIAEIAFAIGFQSASAFSTAFTRAVGTPPSQFAIAARQTAKKQATALKPE